MLFAGPDIVVAEDGISMGAFKAAQQTTALPRCFGSELSWEYLGTDVVAREQDHVRAKSIDVINRFAQQERLCEFVEMNVAQLCKSYAVEIVRKPADIDIPADDLDPVTLKPAGVQRHTTGAEERARQEGSPGEQLIVQVPR